MTITAKLYGLFLKAALNKEIDIDSDTLKVMLTTSAYTPDQDTHDYKNDVTNEITGTGYTAGGAALTTVTVTYTTATNVLMVDADDVSWTSSTITARTAVVYDSSPATDATRPLICYEQSDVDIVSTGGTFQIVWNASGIVSITVS
jgi:hypothetical protein